MGCLLKTGSTESTRELGVGFERKRKAKADCGGLGLSSGEGGGFALAVEMGSLMDKPRSLEVLANKQLYMATLKLV